MTAIAIKTAMAAARELVRTITVASTPMIANRSASVRMAIAATNAEVDTSAMVLGFKMFFPVPNRVPGT